MLNGVSLDAIMAGARLNKVPVYMIRLAYSKAVGDLLPDDMWKKAIERTGGHFYAAANERTFCARCARSTNSPQVASDVREYTARKPRFAGYALIAWDVGWRPAVMKLGIRTSGHSHSGHHTKHLHKRRNS